MEFVRYIMDTILSEDELKNCVFAVVANKQDIDGAMSETLLWKQLNLIAISKTRPCAIFGTSAMNGTGLFEVLEWILDSISKLSLDEKRDDDKNIGHKDGVKSSIFKKPLRFLKDNLLN
ncbi:hypothetical protein KUTeg_011993 [Tegillarca granosa]|uniref:Uncharacterized protein n=1 Tax=Tegillarca granosa TaxID=220873 RepID=A0ABQ9EY99_TEGGR|nr:hypothetical protein KUTeg_011993 [Tegillarca granosa]